MCVCVCNNVKYWNHIVIIPAIEVNTTNNSSGTYWCKDSLKSELTDSYNQKEHQMALKDPVLLYVHWAVIRKGDSKNPFQLRDVMILIITWYQLLLLRLACLYLQWHARGHVYSITSISKAILKHISDFHAKHVWNFTVKQPSSKNVGAFKLRVELRSPRFLWVHAHSLQG